MGQAPTSITHEILFLLLVIYCKVALGDTHIVGDDKGWDYDASAWPLDKHFAAGDVLVFNYKPWQHNVVVVNEKDYYDCTVSPGSKTYDTGMDSITLVKGYNFFISSIGDDCSLGGMQMLVNGE